MSVNGQRQSALWLTVFLLCFEESTKTMQSWPRCFRINWTVTKRMTPLWERWVSELVAQYFVWDDKNKLLLSGTSDLNFSLSNFNFLLFCFVLHLCLFFSTLFHRDLIKHVPSYWFWIGVLTLSRHFYTSSHFRPWPMTCYPLRMMSTCNNSNSL